MWFHIHNFYSYELRLLEKCILKSSENRNVYSRIRELIYIKMCVCAHILLNVCLWECIYIAYTPACIYVCMTIYWRVGLKWGFCFYKKVIYFLWSISVEIPINNSSLSLSRYCPYARFICWLWLYVFSCSGFANYVLCQIWLDKSSYIQNTYMYTL